MVCQHFTPSELAHNTLGTFLINFYNLLDKLLPSGTRSQAHARVHCSVLAVCAFFDIPVLILQAQPSDFVKDDHAPAGDND